LRLRAQKSSLKQPEPQSIAELLPRP
jgi:hypothetical protein